MGTQHTLSFVLCAVAVMLQCQRGAVSAETVRTSLLLRTAGQGRKSRLQSGRGFCLWACTVYSIWCFTENAGWPLRYAIGAHLGGVQLHAMLL